MAGHNISVNTIPLNETEVFGMIGNLSNLTELIQNFIFSPLSDFYFFKRTCETEISETMYATFKFLFYK